MDDARSLGPGGQLPQAHFTDADLRRARFTRCDLGEVRMRTVELGGARIDGTWFSAGSQGVFLNDVEVTGFVEQQLDRRFPGREPRGSHHGAELLQSWDAVSAHGAAACRTLDELPAGTQDLSVDGEWSFAQTLRHLVMATDTWLRGCIFGEEHPYHPIGVPNHEYALDGYDKSVFSESDPDFSRVLQVRAERQQQVRDFLLVQDAQSLQAARRHPWDAEHSAMLSVGAALRVLLDEEYEHLRYAVRDLKSLAIRGEGQRRQGQPADENPGPE